MHVCTLVVLISTAAPPPPLPAVSQGPRQFKERTLRALLESNCTALVVPQTSLSLIWSCQTINSAWTQALPSPPTPDSHQQHAQSRIT